MSQIKGTVSHISPNLSRVDEMATLGDETVDLRHKALLDWPISTAWYQRGTRHLDLSFNRLLSIPDAIGSLTALTHLAVSNNQVESLPTSIGQLVRLQELNLSQNVLKEINIGIGQCTALKRLALSGNKLHSLPGHVGRFSRLQDLQAAGNQLRTLPPEIGNCTELQHVEVQGNAINILPTTICMCNKLTYLDISQNHLEALQGRVYLWVRLKHLDVSCNRLEMLPPALGWLELKFISVRDNPRLRIPATVLEHPAGSVVATLTFLQIIWEQQRLIELHLDQFLSVSNEKRSETFISSDPRRALSARPRSPLHFTEHNDSNAELQRAAGHGLIDLRYCGLSEPPNLVRALPNTAVRVLDLRFNELTALAGALLTLADLVILSVDLPRLAVLNASFNRLSSLPHSLSAATRLQQLYVSNNRLTDLHEGLATLPMVDLFLSENHFTQVPECVCRMTGLIKLSMACNKLTALPPGIGQSTSLQFLDVSFNCITGLPTEISALTALSALNVSFNPLGTGSAEGRFPPALFTLRTLTELNCDHTGCHNIEPAFGNLTALDAIQVPPPSASPPTPTPRHRPADPNTAAGSQQFPHVRCSLLYHHVDQCMQLEGCPLVDPWALLYSREPMLLVRVHDQTVELLDLSNCGLASLPTTITRLTALRHLNLSGNALVNLPRELAGFPNLESIALERNPLAAHLQAILSRGTTVGGAPAESAIIALLSRDATALDLGFLGLTTLPPEVLWHEHALRYLALAHNAFTTLPDSLAMCSHLTHLVLDSNRLAVVPPVILRLLNLRILQLADNCLTTLPVDLTSLTALHSLFVPLNSISEFNGGALAGLPHLLTLSLASNSLTVLPPELGVLTALRSLDITGNRLAALPSTLTALTALRSLRAANNCLAALPVGLMPAALPALTELHLRGNPVIVGSTSPNARSRADVADLLAWAAEAPSQRRAQSVPVTGSDLAAAPTLAPSTTIASMPSSMADLMQQAPWQRVLDSTATTDGISRAREVDQSTGARALRAIDSSARAHPPMVASSVLFSNAPGIQSVITSPSGPLSQLDEAPNKLMGEPRGAHAESDDSIKGVATRPNASSVLLSEADSSTHLARVPPASSALAAYPASVMHLQCTLREMAAFVTAPTVCRAGGIGSKWLAAGRAAGVEPLAPEAGEEPAMAVVSAETLLESLRHAPMPPTIAEGSLRRPQQRARLKRVVKSQLSSMEAALKALGVCGDGQGALSAGSISDGDHGDQGPSASAGMGL